MKIKVLSNYKSPSNFDNPIELLKGDKVQLGEATYPNGEYPNWIFCISNRTGRTGWVASGVLRIEENNGIALQDYTSKELSVNEGDMLIAEYELNGWYWCNRLSDGADGWVAKNIVEVL